MTVWAAGRGLTGGPPTRLAVEQSLLLRDRPVGTTKDRCQALRNTESRTCPEKGRSKKRPTLAKTARMAHPRSSRPRHTVISNGAGRLFLPHSLPANGSACVERNLSSIEHPAQTAKPQRNNGARSTDQRSTPMQFWQTRFYDFNVWSRDKEREKLDYMHANPSKNKLVDHPRVEQFLVLQDRRAGTLSLNHEGDGGAAGCGRSAAMHCGYHLYRIRGGGGSSTSAIAAPTATRENANDQSEE
jgi:hypothetical protein